MDSPQTNESSQDEILSDILKKFTASGAPSAASFSQSDSTSGGAGDILSAFLSNPELIAKLPGIVASVRPIIEMLGKGSPITSAPPPTSSGESVSTALSISKSHTNDSRTALLCALKPYLGAERQNAIDYVVKLGRLSEVLKTL